MRKQFITWLFHRSQRFYTQYFKRNTPWPLTVTDLLRYPNGSLGHRLGLFLHRSQFHLLPKVEHHDIYHLLSGIGTEVESEIALQYFLLGNGKRSPYLIGSILVGSLLLPEYGARYVKSYYRGRRANQLYHIDFLPLLTSDFQSLRSSLLPNSSEQRSHERKPLLKTFLEAPLRKLRHVCCHLSL